MSFHFVDARPQEVLDLAWEAAGDLEMRIGGGPTVVLDFFAAHLIDTLHVAVAKGGACAALRRRKDDPAKASRPSTNGREGDA